MTGPLKGGSFSAFKTDSFLLNARADGTEEQQQKGRPNRWTGHAGQNQNTCSANLKNKDLNLALATG